MRLMPRRVRAVLTERIALASQLARFNEFLAWAFVCGIDVFPAPDGVDTPDQVFFSRRKVLGLSTGLQALKRDPTDQHPTLDLEAGRGASVGEPWTFHDLRHSHAAIVIAQGAPKGHTGQARSRLDWDLTGHLRPRSTDSVRQPRSASMRCGEVLALQDC
jgi:hypothetical protein